MTGKELTINAINRKKVERVPWVPFVGCHGGALIGVTAQEYHRSEDNIVKAADEAIKRYKPDGLPVTFDLQVEAEALGCDLIWADENPPAVKNHPLANGKTISDLHIPQMNEGRIGLTINAAKRIHADHPEIALYGLITGPFTLALHLQGTELFMKMFDDEEYIKQLMNFCKDVSKKMADYYIEAGCDVIAIVDPMTSQIGSEQFRQFVSEPMSEVFDHIRKQDSLSSFFVCGQAQQNIEVMCQCKPDNVSIDENIPLDYVRDVCKEHQISFGGNLQLTVVLLLGSEEDSQRNALSCLEIGGNEGFILAPGCDLPYATPPQNLEAVTQIVHDPYQQEVIKTLEVTSKSEDLLDMSEYGYADKVIVDVITLDSESCAPCQYMVESVKSITPQFEGIVEWREHKIKHPDSVMFMSSLMVKNIPTICIDGKITFVSRIPPKEELISAIQKRIIEKLHYKIRMKKGSVLILGKDEAECDKLKPSVLQAIRELGGDMGIQYITDEKERFAYGVLKTPAVVVANYKIKSEGTKPSIAIIKEWIKDVI
jgi:MtaA/CmuA family methyltransferase